MFGEAQGRLWLIVVRRPTGYIHACIEGGRVPSLLDFKKDCTLFYVEIVNYLGLVWSALAVLVRLDIDCTERDSKD